MQVRVVFIALVFISAARGAQGYGWWTNWWHRWACKGWFSWFHNDGDSYSSERISEMRTIAGSCRVDVGRCPVGSCTTKPYSFCPHDGYICPETETGQVECFTKNQTYQYVKRCVCCEDNGITVKGIVADASTNSLLENMKVYIDGRFVATTNTDGTFTTTIRSSVRSIVVKSLDRKGDYMDAVKNEDIAEGFRGPINVKLLMIKKADPVEIDSSVETTLSLSNDPLNPSAGNTVIEIPANAFRKRRGQIYSGPVNASITFIDTLNEDESITPGRFVTRDGNGLEPLISDGIFSFNFKTKSGDPLRLTEPIKFTMREGMRVWKLNSNTGYWESATNTPRRGKRQLTIDDILSIDSDLWYNIDKIPGAPKCYFKGRIFSESDGVEIISSNTASFKPGITAYTYLLQRLRLYAGYTYTPAATCYEVRCPVVTNPNKTLVGFINMTATEIVPIGGLQIPVISYLTPRVVYDIAIQPAMFYVNYTVVSNDIDIYVHFKSDNAGPFYRNRNKCESSLVTEPAFHFFKPAPPSYLPVPDDTEICSARIVFRDSWNFYNYTANATTLPNITAVSVWEEDGYEYYFTDVVQMETFTDGNQSFIAICVKYRCSQDNETTLVYLDIDIPTVNVTYNYTSPNGSVVNYTYSQQDFYCYGNRSDGSVFFNQETDEDVTTVEGSFDAPIDVYTHPGFYNSTDCYQDTSAQDFAYEFFCHSNEGNFEK